MRPYDVIVIGLGGMGGAALYHLAKRGASVMGIEQFEIGHDRGSSHGRTRIMRRAYFEHPDYVPLVDRSHVMWAALADETGEALLHRSGLFLAGRPEDAVIRGVREAARAHAVRVETVDHADLDGRFPGLRAANDMEVVFEPDAGFLRVEECVRAHVERASALGAYVRLGEEVETWEADANGVRIVTDRGTYLAEKLIICAGPWAGQLLSEMRIPLDVRRVVVVWFRSDNPAHRLDQGAPVFGYDLGDGFFYGFPVLDDRGMKIGEHIGRQRVTNPSSLDRTLHEDDLPRLHSLIDRFLPGVTHEVISHGVCMYTMTPDEHFIVDRHPHHENVFFAAGFSGHGFKFAPVIGAALADLCIKGNTDAPIEFLSASRPALHAHA